MIAGTGGRPSAGAAGRPAKSTPPQGNRKEFPLTNGNGKITIAVIEFNLG
jgi:hypothetical protein